MVIFADTFASSQLAAEYTVYMRERLRKRRERQEEGEVFKPRVDSGKSSWHVLKRSEDRGLLPLMQPAKKY